MADVISGALQGISSEPMTRQCESHIKIFTRKEKVPLAITSPETNKECREELVS